MFSKFSNNSILSYVSVYLFTLLSSPSPSLQLVQGHQAALAPDLEQVLRSEPTDI